MLGFAQAALGQEHTLNQAQRAVWAAVAGLQLLLAPVAGVFESLVKLVFAADCVSELLSSR